MHKVTPKFLVFTSFFNQYCYYSFLLFSFVLPLVTIYVNILTIYLYTRKYRIELVGLVILTGLVNLVLNLFIFYSTINCRYGFNSDGHEKVLKRLQVLKGDPDFKGIIGVNLGKNKNSDDPISDYVKGIEKFGRVADYLVINISSPNTPGLRSMQQRDILGHLLSTLIQIRDSLECENKPPLLLKLAPDLSYKERRDIAKILNQPDCKVPIFFLIQISRY